MLRFKRANIEKNAQNKYEALHEIILEIGNKNISDTIIFVSPQQINTVMKMLGKNNITSAKFTQEQGTTPSPKFGGISEREYIIKLFHEKKYQVLLAIKCLDEGIDIPSAKRAIVMASSTNPREYIQRVGRIIRQDKGKFKAYLYDLIIKPNLNSFDNPVIANLEKRIFQKEMDRVLELSKNAINNATVTTEVDSIQRSI
jgi:superfamily II DNA or RNA helicase